ncbi:putative membrane protein [Haloactinospora alba]|uniref:Putative membrane protein n=1 Tax=Haloactinospora alba TaxID=405555 RepID=A0A543NI61_9ACTN|nr:PH domain-containing protein [Haloactinospora alba]TQN31444.1 putative membrane protein [Haloactinospora alba]
MTERWRFGGGMEDNSSSRPDREGEDAEEVPAPSTTPSLAGEEERRLSALTLVTAPIAHLKNFITPIAIAVVAGTFNPWILVSAAVAVLGMFVSGLVTWRTFRYRLGEQRLEIRQGLLNRSRRSIPVERIRGVDITSKLLHRALGLAVVQIEAAAGGGASEEGKLDAVTVAEAQRVRRELLHRRAVLLGESSRGHVTDAAEAATTEEEDRSGGEGQDGRTSEREGQSPAETVYFVMPRRWYFYSLLSLGYLLTPFAALATLLGFLAQNVDEVIDTTPGSAAYETAESMLRGGTMVLIALGASAFVLLLLMMPVFAVVSYTVTHWGFTLSGRTESLVAERGLFTRQNVTLERRRIRGYELLDTPLQRSRSAVRLNAVVTGLGEATTRAALLPIGDRPRVTEVVEKALVPYRGTLRSHPRAALGRRLSRAVVPWGLASVVAVFLGFPWLALVLGLGALLGIPLGVDRYRSLGHGRDRRMVSARWGTLRRRQAHVQRDAIIGWNWRQSPFQRRPGLATAQFAVGAGAGAYPIVDADFADSVAFAADVTPEVVRPFLVPQQTEEG